VIQPQPKHCHRDFPQVPSSASTASSVRLAAATYFSGKGIKQKGVVVGVTHVRFVDGSEWNYPLEAKGRFEEQPDEKLDQKIRDLTEKQFPNDDTSWVFPAAGVKGKFSTCQK
jgi:hypothetical protein